MRSTHQHAPTPWIGSPSGDINDADANFIFQLVPAARHRANSSIRIGLVLQVVECANACKGLVDPVKDLKQVKEALRHSIYLLGSLTIHNDYQATTYQSALDAFHLLEKAGI